MSNVMPEVPALPVGLGRAVYLPGTFRGAEIHPGQQIGLVVLHDNGLRLNELALVACERVCVHL